MVIPSELSDSFWLQVCTAVLCGAIVGIERQIKGKPAGIRTSILICLGTQVFVYLGAGLVSPSTDPSRVLGQVVTGVGFLGAGVILARGELVTGVTSAAVIWVLAAIGAAIGLGQPAAAIGLSIIAVAVLTGVRQLERIFTQLRRGSDEPDC